MRLLRQIVAWTSVGVLLGAALWFATPSSVRPGQGSVTAVPGQVYAENAQAPAQEPRAADLRLRAEQMGRRTPGGLEADSPNPGVFDGQADRSASQEARRQPREHRMQRGTSFDGDVRLLPRTRPVRRLERPEREAPDVTPVPLPGTTPAGGAASQPISNPPFTLGLNGPAPATTANFDGLDFATWGSGHPPDTNGDVGPNHYIEVVNASIGIYDKSNRVQLAAFTFDTLMSQGNFLNLCDTDNYGDPVVLYDTFEDRWVITDFAFKIDASGKVINPPGSFQCFAVSKTADPVGGGWNFYSVNTTGGLGDYPKFGIWPDGLYMSTNMFGYAAGFQNVRLYAFNKAQMYAGAPSIQVVSFDAPSGEFSFLPANARLQTGTPPTGSPNYFTSVWKYLNAIGVWKFHVDWTSISASTLTGPFNSATGANWSQLTPSTVPSPANRLDTLYPRLMAQNQYTNIDGVESLWDSHTVGASGATSAQAAPRYYQVNITGGVVAANTTQAFTHSPDTTVNRFMPSVAVDRAGNMAIGYSGTSASLDPVILYAGRLSTDPPNSITQTEVSLIQGTGSQLGNCGSSSCVRWGDYSAMTLDPDGCAFWYASEYYTENGLDDHTRIGSFSLPGCSPVGSGRLQGVVRTSAALGSLAIGGATVALGSRTTTTDSGGNYSFDVPAGTYPGVTASFPGFTSVTFSPIVVADSGTTTRDFSLGAAPASGCFIDTTQANFQTGIAANCDSTSSPGDVTLVTTTSIDQQNLTVTTSGYGFTSTSWAGQTFTPAVTSQLARADLYLFCSGCTGTTPNLTVSIKATTTGATPVPTGADLATSTIIGFNSGAGGYFAANFASPATLTAGKRYAVIVRAVSNPSAGTYAYVVSSTNPYASGQRVTSTNSGASWSADTTSGGRDLGFKMYMQAGFAPSGTFVSSVKDANPAAGVQWGWGNISWNASVPSGTALQFQAAASSSPGGPFNFVGPDGTASSFFTTNGASLAQFNGNRYLQYQARLTTSNSGATPTLNDVTVCFGTGPWAAATAFAVSPASGTYGGTTSLSATLTSGGSGVGGKSISFTLNGSGVGSATTDVTGLATLSGVSLAGINAGSYPGSVVASFGGDGDYASSGGSSSLTVGPAGQTISFGALAGKTWGDPDFGVSATASSGLSVSFSASGNCTVTGATVHLTGAGSCTITASQPGNGNFLPAASVAQSFTIAQGSAAPDLVETSVVPGASNATRGGTLSVTDTVKNQGPVTTGVSSTTRYYLSLDPSGTGAILLTRSRTVPVLAAGGTSKATVTVSIPGSTATGRYYVRACADALNGVSESVEINNCTASATTIRIR